MNYFNIDLHVSVIEDLRSLFSCFGHDITNWSLSSHNWVFGKEKKQVDIVNAQTWFNLDEDMCHKFYNRYKDELSCYDGFIVTHTPSFALLYREFDKPIYVVASTRYEAPFSGSRTKWEWLNKSLTEMYQEGRLILTANNKYDKAYCELFTGMEWQHIPSICDYTGISWKPEYETFLVDSRLIRLKINSPLIYRNQLGRYRWDELGKYKGIVVIPYNASIISIFEYYSACIPLFFPSADFSRRLYATYRDYGVYSELSWNKVTNLPGGSVIPLNTNVSLRKIDDPNDYENPGAMSSWIRLSDWYDSEWMPYITYFDSFEDLEYRLANADLNSISRNMARHNVNRKRNIMALWKEKLIDFPKDINNKEI